MGKFVLSWDRFMSRAIAVLALAAIPCAPVEGQTALSALVEMSDISGLSISPDGQMVAFRVARSSIARNEDESAWFVQPLAGGPAVRIADGGTPLRTYSGTLEPVTVRWSSDSRWIYFLALREGATQLWRASVARAEQITSDAADIRSFALTGNDRMVYAVGASRAAILAAEAHEYDSGILIDETTPIGGAGLYRSTPLGGRLSSLRYSGQWMGRRTLLSHQPLSYHVVDLQSMRTRDADPAERAQLEPAASTTRIPQGATTDGRDDEQGVPRAYAISRDTTIELQVLWPDGRLSRCTSEVCREGEISWIRWRPTGTELVFATIDRTRGGMQSVYSWDPTRNRLRHLAGSEGYLNGGSASIPGDPCTVGQDAVVCVEATANIPPRLVRLGRHQRRHVVLHDPNTALQQTPRARAELLRWQDAGGRLFTGQFYQPLSAGARPAPVVILYYQCHGFIRGGTGDEWPLAAMAEQGISALCINATASPAGGTEPPAIASYQAALDGITSVLPVLRARGVDTDRVGMGGFSFGSEVLMWVAMNSDILDVASVASPMVTPTYMRFHDIQGGDFRRRVREAWGLGDLNETPEQWRRLSPMFNLERLHLPLLMQLPEQEYIPAIDYYSPLRRAGAPVELWVFPNEPHTKHQPRHRLAIYERNLDWFRFWLTGREDPDPTKSGQYSRWHDLRMVACRDPQSTRSYCRSGTSGSDAPSMAEGQ